MQTQGTPPTGMPAAMPFPQAAPSPQNLGALVPGVSVPGVAPVSRPSAGPPHTLPPMPTAAVPSPPVPNGFPNPFAGAQPGAPPLPTQTLPPGAIPNPALASLLSGMGVSPALQGQAPGAAPQGFPLPQAGPVQPAWVPPMSGGAVGMAPPPPAPVANPSVQQLAAMTQSLLQNTKVKETVGGDLQSLMSRPDMAQFLIGLGCGVLATAEGQTALWEFREGKLNGDQLAAKFGSRLKSMLEMHGLIGKAPAH